MKKRHFFTILSLSVLLTGCQVPSQGGENKPPQTETEDKKEYDIVLNLQTGARAKLLVEGKEVTKAKKGELVTLNLEFDNEHKFKAISSDEVQFETLTEGSSYTFVMTDKAVRINIETEYIKQSFKINVDAPKEATIKLEVDGKEVTEALEESLVTLKLSFTKNFILKGLTSSEVTFETIKEGEEYTFIMPKKEVSIKVEAQYVKQISPITLVTPEEVNGTLLVDGKPVTEALEGTTVTLSLETKEKYEVTEVTSSQVALETVEKGKKYTFVMAAEPVTINVSSEYVKQTYNVLSINEFSSSKHTISGLKVNDAILEGDAVTLTYNATKTSTKIYVLYVNETRVEGVEQDGSTAFTFKMPTENIDLAIVEETLVSTDETNALPVTFNASEDNSYAVYGIINGGKYKYKNYETLKAYIVPKAGYILKVEYSVDGGRYISQSGSNNAYSFQIYNAKESFDIKITSEFVGVKTIEFLNSENVEVIGGLEYTPGDNVKLTVKGKNSYTVTGIEKTETDDPEISLRPSYYEGDISFVMPKANVKITLKVVKSVALKANANDKISSFKFLKAKNADKEGIESALPGDTVYIHALPIEGYKITNIYYGEDLKCSYDPYWDGTPFYSFKVPEAEEIIITFEVAELKTFTYDLKSTVYKISGISKTEFAVGEKVTFSLKALVGHGITEVKLDDESTSVIREENTNNYSFTMPNKDVALVVNSNTLETGTLNFDKPSELKYFTFRNVDDNNINIQAGEKVNAGTKVSAEFSLANGFTIKEAKLSDGTALTLNEKTGLYEFIMPSGEVSVELTFTESAKNTISIDTFGGAVQIKNVLDANNTVKVNEDGTYFGYVGSEITVEMTIKDTHYFDLNAFKVTKNDGTIVEHQVKELFSSIKVTFIMPEEAVRLTPGAKEHVLYTFNKKGEHQDKYKIIKGNAFTGDEVTSAKKGDKIYIKLNMDQETYSSYSSVSVCVTDDTTNKVLLEKKFNNKSDYWSFEMPESTVTIEIIATL